MNLPAIASGAQILAEKRHDVVLKAVGYGAGMSAMIDLEGIGDAITVESVMQLARVDSQVVLIADIHRDGAIPT
jgi:hypothetical protein